MELILLIVCLLVYGVREFLKVKELKRKEKDELFEDELIYDPDSGKEFTIDEAESIVLKSDKNRMIPDEELEKYFSDEYREIEYLRRFFASREIFENSNIFSFSSIISKGRLMNHYNDYDLSLFKIMQDVYMGWVYVLYSVLEGRKFNQYEEYQMVIVINKPVQNLWISEIPGIEYEIIEDVVFIKSIKEFSFDHAKGVFEILLENAGSKF